MYTTSGVLIPGFDVLEMVRAEHQAGEPLDLLEVPVAREHAVVVDSGTWGREHGRE